MNSNHQAAHPNPLLKRFCLHILSSEYLILYVSIAYFLVVWPFIPQLGSSYNLRSILSNLLPLLVVCIGQTVVLITAGIDLSVTSTIALSSVVGALIMNGDTGLLAGSAWSLPLGVAAMIGVGALLGLFNGTAITRFHMPPFIVTLTTMMFFSGLAIWLTKSRNIYNLPEGFIRIWYGGIRIVPNAFIVVVLTAVCAHLLLNHTVAGKWIYAVGMSTKTSVTSGVPVSRVITFAYIFSGICAALSSILYTSRLETGSPVHGQRILLDIIGAVVIGGSSLFGGKGKILWTVFGVLFITIIDNSLNMLGLSHFFIMMVKGSVILLAALIDVVRNRYLASV